MTATEPQAAPLPLHMHAPVYDVGVEAPAIQGIHGDQIRLKVYGESGSAPAVPYFDICGYGAYLAPKDLIDFCGATINWTLKNFDIDGYEHPGQLSTRRYNF